jgi:hypothetical protein
VQQGCHDSRIELNTTRILPLFHHYRFRSWETPTRRRRRLDPVLAGATCQHCHHGQNPHRDITTPLAQAIILRLTPTGKCDVMAVLVESGLPRFWRFRMTIIIAFLDMLAGRLTELPLEEVEKLRGPA